MRVDDISYVFTRSHRSPRDFLLGRKEERKFEVGLKTESSIFRSKIIKR